MSAERRPQHRLRALTPAVGRRHLAHWHPGRSRRWRQLPGVQRVEGGQAVLTFDDGPGSDATPQVLVELSRVNALATFFVLGRDVQREPQLAREIVAQRHEIALHGFDHLRHDRLIAKHARRDLEAGIETVQDVTGHRPTWFRPPYGRISRVSYDICASLGLRVAYWSGWGLDWEEVRPADIVAEVEANLRAGSIVLLHDTARYGHRSSAHATASAVRPIVELGRRRGLTWRTLDEATSGT